MEFRAGPDIRVGGLIVMLMGVGLLGYVSQPGVGEDLSEEFTLEYMPVMYSETDLFSYPYHAWFEYVLPVSSDVQFLNIIAGNPDNGTSDWVGQNIPLPPGIEGGLPVRMRLDLASISDISGLPLSIWAEVHVGEFQIAPDFPVDSFLLPAVPAAHYLTNGSAMTWHPIIPYFPPIIPPIIPPVDIRLHYRGCEVPNVDLDSSTNPGVPGDPSTSDINACGPAATANSMHWLDQQHDEINIPGNLRSSLDSLKKLMNQEADGVTWDDLIKGKLAFIDKYQLPIHVKFQSHVNDETIESPDPTYGHHADNETEDGNHPQFDWFADEMDAGEDVEVLIGFYCDTTIYDTMIVIEIIDGMEVETTVIDTIMKKKRSGGHYMNMTGYIDLGNGRKWVSFKHDPVQDGPDGNIEEFSEWIIDTAGYAIIQSQSGGDCTAYVESVTSESYDPSIDFCPIVRNAQEFGFGSINWALTAVNPGGKIKIHPLLADSTISLTTPIIIDFEVEIESPVEILVSGASTTRPFDITATGSVHIDNINVEGGSSPEGSAFRNQGMLTLEDSQVRHRQPGSTGELVTNDGGQLRIIGTTELQRDD